MQLVKQTKDKKEEKEKSQEVALLMSDRGQAKEVSKCFRKVKIIPSLFDSLSSFWEAILKRTPTLLVVDVKVMNKEGMFLKDHPLVKDEKVNLVFYYDEASEPLTFSTQNIFNWGSIKGDLPLEGQIKAILKRINKVKSIENDVIDSHEKALAVRRPSEKMDRVVRLTQKLNEEGHYSRLLKTWCEQLENGRLEEDFYTMIERVVNGWEQVSEFTFMELSGNGQKLLSPPVSGKKYKRIPSLWLGQACAEGIEFFAQNMANQVCLDVMGGNIIPLMVRGKHDLPDLMFQLKIDDEDFLKQFDWKSFENYLSGLYGRFELRHQALSTENSEIMHPWEAFSFMDQFIFGQIDSSTMKPIIEDKMGLIDIDFSSLVDLIRSKSKLKFYWKSFFEDYFGKFRGTHSWDIQIVPMGVQHVGVLVDREDAEAVFDAIKAYSLRFSFWRYFEDMEFVLARNMKPTIKMVPFSSSAFLRVCDDQLATIETRTAPAKKSSKRIASLPWGRGPEADL